ncbi:Rieske (2Fe-2S) protein [Bacillus sp. B15-48]|uniref:Rieske (2Fe-2S) protein n=1 Tax=Bacillus sp. B15-48 TaxID=1548601 RepID=UPI00193F3670|nr:Rieske (2Fe-2S) protein [Bacillus sp. B15-48]MBM4764740.1 Rieske 2Fe-2S domain-containing protein [Bacillus sp. B15-48]
MKEPVCKINEFDSSNMKAVTINNKPIVLVKSENGEVYALKNACPHKGPCLSGGMVDNDCSSNEVGQYNFERDKEVIRCPWHSWEFDIKTGQSIINPEKVRVKTYDVTIKDDKIFVDA